jgi:hypothetical protein
MGINTSTNGLSIGVYYIHNIKKWGNYKIMRIIIYLASHDSSAVNNYIQLRDNRETTYRHQVHLLRLDVKKDSLQPLDHLEKFDVFAKIPAAKYRSVKIEFVAHGNPHYSKELLSIPMNPATDPDSKEERHKQEIKRKSKEAARNNVSLETQAASQNMRLDPADDKSDISKTEKVKDPEEITPIMLAKYFKKYAWDDKIDQFKFGLLTLFCCTSAKFAEDLSNLLPGVIIEAHKDPITIDEKGNPCLEDGITPSLPVIFKNPENLPDFKFEIQTQMQTAEDELVWSMLSMTSTSSNNSASITQANSQRPSSAPTSSSSSSLRQSQSSFAFSNTQSPGRLASNENDSTTKTYKK